MCVLVPDWLAGGSHSDRGVELGGGVDVVGGVEAGTAAAGAASDATAGAAGVSAAHSGAEEHFRHQP